MTTTIEQGPPTDADLADGVPRQDTLPGGQRSRLTWLAWTVFAVVAGLAVLTIVAFFLGGAHRPGTGWGTTTALGLVLSLLPGLAAASVGAFLAARMPSNRIGWLFLFAGLSGALAAAGSQYAHYGAVNLGSLPRPDIADWMSQWSWVPAVVFTTTMVPLIYPDGRLTPRRRPLAVAAVVAIGVVMAGLMFEPIHLPEVNGPNPFAISSHASLFTGMANATPLLGICMVLAIGTLARRFRRTTGDEHLQIKWFLFAAAIAVGIFIIAIVLLVVGHNHVPTWQHYLQDASIATITGLPVATVIAIRKYRLYEIDVIVSKTVVFAALGVFITAVYVGIVVGIGSAFGSHGNRFLPVLAAAVIAVAFQPVRDRARSLANRIVFGPRATPYEVLSRFADRMGTTYANEDVLPRMARTVAEGVGATRAEVWLRVGSQLRLAARHPSSNDDAEAMTVATTGVELPPLPGLDRAFEVRHQGELLGALGVAKPPAEPLSTPEEALLQDLAVQAGLVLRNVSLTSELLARLDELQASRQRIVAAQDTERRRLERNIHDGAQQQLVALSVKLRLADMLLDKDPAKSHRMLSELQHDTVEALNNLRDLARGIYPPLLADQGLEAALAAQIRKAPMPVELDAGDVRRHPAEVEAAVYFSCLEALQNVSKYASATRVGIRLREQDGALSFEVQDDGSGFDAERVTKGAGLQNMEDRLAALGGTLQIRSAPAGGTMIVGRVPVLEPAPRA